MVTFEVTPNLKPVENKFPPFGGMLNPKQFFERVHGRKEKVTIEAAGGVPSLASGGARQGLMDATHMAFDSHLPLVLSPDSIWLTISQGVARHVTENAEKLRKRFVTHEGKKELVIQRDEFIRGNPNNDWPGCWEEFSQQIREKTVKKTYERLISDFSTTGALEKAISNLTLMDTMSGYFSYGVMTCCGIPKVTLLGTPDDWKKLYDKAAVLSEYELEWWIPKLLPVLEQFKLSAEGKHDQKWWQDFYKWHSMSGGDFIDGHIIAFFPFVETIDNSNKLVYKLVYKQRTNWDQSSTDQTPSGMVKVPFNWYYNGETLKMFFKGGLVGVEQTEEGLKPACAWAVTDG